MAVSHHPPTDFSFPPKSIKRLISLVCTKRLGCIEQKCRSVSTLGGLLILVHGPRWADNIERIVPPPHWLVMFPCFRGDLCSHDQPESYWVDDYRLPSTNDGAWSHHSACHIAVSFSPGYISC